MDLKNDQLRAVEITDRNVVVSAGAGTGKTAVLVARFVHLVRSGFAKVDEILAITFTEKAAEEMKQRIASEFHLTGMRKEKTAIETAYISTIHSFCARLIRENPFAAGVDPGFEVMDEMDRHMLLGELFDDLFSHGDEDFLELAEHYGERSVSGAIIAYMDLCRSLGREIGHIEKLLAEPEILTNKARAAAERRARRAMEQIRVEVDALSRLRGSRSCEERRQQIVALRDRLLDAELLQSTAEELTAITSRMPVVPKKGDDREACLEIRERLSRIRSVLKAEQPAIFFDRAGEETLLPTKLALLKGVALFWRNYEQRKRQNGVLDYEDLQLTARRLLRDDAAVRREYAERFRYVLVDEFQDINGLQKELIGLLTSGMNLFVVGDTHQSIYGFRNADVKILADLVRRCEASPETHGHVFLSDNFRSGPNLIQFFNFFFSTLWSTKDCDFQPLRHARENETKFSGPSVEVVLASPAPSSPSPSKNRVTPAGRNNQQSRSESGPESAEEVRQEEAGAVAARLARVIEHGEIAVHDTKTKMERPVTYGDVAVLCRSRASYESYTKAFDELGIPYCTVAGLGFYDKQEVTDLVNFLRVIDNPLRDIPLAAVLRSPFVGICEDTLFLMRRQVESEYDSPWVMESLRRAHSIPEISDGEKDTLREFLLLLDELRGKKESLRVHELVKAAVDATPYTTRILASRGGSQKAANVSKFLNILREYDAKQTGGLAGFLRFYEVMTSFGPQEEEAALESFSGDVIKLMTIHSAKGLEFPVVVVADMGRRFNFDTDRFLVSEEMEIGCDSWEETAEPSSGRKLVCIERKEKQLGEEGRLLYVAMTRARDHLILAGSYRSEKERDQDKANCPLDWLLAIVGRDACLPERGDSSETTLGGAKVQISVNIPVEPPASRVTGKPLIERYHDRIAAAERIPVPEKLSSAHLPHVKAVLERLALRRHRSPTSLPAELSVTQLMLYDACPCKFFLREMIRLPGREVMQPLGLCSSAGFPIQSTSPEGASELPSRPRGRRFGELVHRCLEQIDLRTGDPQDLPRTVARFFSAADEASAAERLIRQFFRSKEGAALRNAREIYREIQVKGVWEDVVINGVIDVLYRNDAGRWTILDFKTGAVPQEQGSQHHGYVFQMLAYAVLVADAVGECPEAAVLYFLESGTPYSVQTGADEIEQTKKRIGKIINAIAGGESRRGEGVDCSQCEYSAVCPSQDNIGSLVGEMT